MGFALDSLRNLIPFAAPEGEEGDAAYVRRWLERHAHDSPDKIAIGLSSRIPVTVEKQKNLHTRLRLLETLRNFSENILCSIEASVALAPLPIAREVQAAALAADNLLKALTTSYTDVVHTIETRRLGSSLNPLLHAPLLAGMRLIVRRQGLAYLAYAHPSPTSWQQLHAFHALARARSLESLAAKDGSSIEGIYLCSLLRALADPTKRSRSDMKIIDRCIDRLWPMARMPYVSNLSTHDRRSKSLFLIQPGSGAGATPLSKATGTPPPDALALDTRNVVAELKRSLGQPGPGICCPVDVLESLIDMWSNPPCRRYSRSRTKPKADLVSGITSVAQYLQSAYTRRETDPAPHTRTVVSEWYIVNESPDGFGLRYLSGDPGSVDVGDLVGVRPYDRSRVHVCLVRRVSNAGHGRFELGLQELSPLALPIPLAADAASDVRDAILLPYLPGFDNASGLVAPAGMLASGAEVSWSRNNLNFRRQLDRRILGNEHTDLFLLA